MNAVHDRGPALGRLVAHAAQAVAPWKKMPVPLLATALALAARWALDPWLGDRHEFLPVYLAIAAATWLATWRAGAVVSVLFLLLAEVLFGAPRSAADASASHNVLATVSYAALSMAVIVAVHSAARAHHRLRERLRELDEADHRKSDFVALLAHELRNPLAVLSADTALIRQGKLDPGALEGAWRALERQTSHMKRIVADLLDTARIEQGKLELQREMVNVAALVTQAVADAETFTAVKGQRLLLTVTGRAGYMVADPQRIRQVLDNLLHNASKFSPEGAAIRVALSASRDEVCVAVRDSGIGMDPQDLREIFRNFVQVGPAAGKVQGLGLGLALCRTLVEMHGGSIAAYSSGAGCGSEFLLRLPRPPELATCGAVPPEGPARAPAAEAEGCAPALSHLKVLVVDDNADAADSLALLLEMAGHQPVVAYGGQAAIELARTEQPRIVFLDMRLPDLPVAEVAAKLREGPAATRPALIGMSGLPPEEGTAPAGMAGFMLKPFDLAAIVSALAAAERQLAQAEASVA